MAIKPVLKMGNPLLNQIATPVAIADMLSPEIQSIIKDMKDTLDDQQGLGIAAPQIGILKNIIIFGYENSLRYQEATSVPLTVLINPVITPLSEEMDDAWEGCFCLPGLRGLVSRPTYIRYEGYNEKGAFISVEAKGLHARVVQHEADHLNGILFPKRIKNIQYFGFEDSLDYQMKG